MAAQAEVAGLAHSGQIGVVAEVGVCRADRNTFLDAQQVPDGELQV